MRILTLLSIFSFYSISQAATVSADLTVEMEVKNFCSFTYSHPTINITYSLSSPSQTFAYLYAKCNIGTTYNIEMDYGQYGTNVSNRKMKHKTDDIYLPYLVYQGSTTTPLGLKSDNQHMTNIGDGSTQNNQFVFYLDGSTHRVKQGSYNDVVRLMVSY